MRKATKATARAGAARSAPTGRFAFPVLIGDIGGTNARFAMLPGPRARPVGFAPVLGRDYPSLAAAIEHAVLSRSPIRPRTAILAVAGVVTGEAFGLTNLNWLIRPALLAASLAIEEVVVINDFEAQALAAIGLAEEDREQIGGLRAEADAPRVVLGPGTGLGIAGLIRHGRTWLPVAGEGGHVDIGPRGEREAAIFARLDRADGRVSAEEVLSGRGLFNLYSAILRLEGEEPALAGPEAVSAAGLADPSSRAGEALRLFVTLLGRLAGDLALVFMARGGVYLTGGIARNILPALRDGAFRRAFEDKAPHGRIVAAIPTFVITHPLAPLSGLADFARRPRRFGVDTAGRRWRASAAETPEPRQG
jgi:glucokinase